MGLLRGVARTAVVAGTATHVSNNASRRQAKRWNDQAQKEQTDQPAAATVDQDDSIAQLEKLAELKDKGILTQEEFDAKKKQLLGI